MGLVESSDAGRPALSQDATLSLGARDQPAALHVVALEEAGPCTLRALAQSARAGDSVLVLGARRGVDALREYGLARTVACENVLRVGGSWRLCVRAIAAAAKGFNRITAYGVRAQQIMHRAGCLHCARGHLDASAHVSARCDDNRASLRRALGIAAHEAAVLVVAEPAAWTDLRFIAHGASMAYVGGARIRLIVSPNVPALAEAGSWMTRAAGELALHADERAEEPWQLLDAIDGIIMDRDGGVEAPVRCIGDRTRHPFDARWKLSLGTPSPLPALVALGAGIPALVHSDIDLGAHSTSPLVTRFDRNIAALARAFAAVAQRVPHAHTLQPSSASAASR